MSIFNNFIRNSFNFQANQIYFKMWSIYTMEYYSALKRKEILTHATTCMNIEDTLSEII